MTKPRLNPPRIVPRIGQRVAAGVPEHMDVDAEERQAGALADALHKQIDSVRGEWPAALGGEHIAAIRELALELAQWPQLVTLQRVNRWA